MYIRANSAMRRREGIESPSCAVRTMQQPGLGRLRGRGLGDSTAGQVASDLVPDWLKTAFNYWTFQPNWSNPNAPLVFTPAQYAAQQASPPPATPSSSYSDLLLNAVTGQATTAQIQANANDCIANVARMRALAAANGTPAPPANAEQLCQTDQASFLANAVSWQSLLSNVTNPSSTALWVLLGIGGVIGLVVWSRR